MASKHTNQQFSWRMWLNGTHWEAGLRAWDTQLVSDGCPLACSLGEHGFAVLHLKSHTTRLLTTIKLPIAVYQLSTAALQVIPKFSGFKQQWFIISYDYGPTGCLWICLVVLFTCLIGGVGYYWVGGGGLGSPSHSHSFSSKIRHLPYRAVSGQWPRGPRWKLQGLLNV